MGSFGTVAWSPGMIVVGPENWTEASSSSEEEEQHIVFA